MYRSEIDKSCANSRLASIIRALQDGYIIAEDLDQGLLKQLLDLIGKDDPWDRLG